MQCERFRSNVEPPVLMSILLRRERAEYKQTPPAAFALHRGNYVLRGQSV
jgi:hypothetical protein